MNANLHRRHLPALSILGLALLGVLSMPAHAADPACQDSSGSPIGGSTDAGNENGQDNATCTDTASAYGELNNASAAYSSAFGFFNTASGSQSSAFGQVNLASGYASSAFGFNGGAYGAGSVVLSGWWDRNGNGGIDGGAGETSFAGAASSVSVGAGTSAIDNSSVAMGVGSVAGTNDGNFVSGRNSVAIGSWTDLNGNGVLEPGERTTSATGTMSAAVGVGSQASGDNSAAFGTNALAGGEEGAAFGVGVEAQAAFSVAVGRGNLASGEFSSAVGNGNTASAVNANAAGVANGALGDWSNAIGIWNVASSTNSSAIGLAGLALGEGSLALSSWDDLDGDGGLNYDVGPDGLDTSCDASLGQCSGSTETARALGRFSVAIGGAVLAQGEESLALGLRSSASGDRSSAIGYGNTAVGDYGMAIGFQSQALNVGSTALGYQAIADRDYAVSVGSSGGEHQIIHVAAGTQATDAVNVGQLNATIATAGGFADFSGMMSAFGGGAAWAGGTFVAPTFTIQGSDFHDVASAFAAVDSRFTLLAGSSGTPVPAGPPGASAMDTAYVDAGDATSLASANAHSDAGDAATLTASQAYTDTQATTTLASANGYTDRKLASWSDTFHQFQQQTDRRFIQTDRRIDRVGAMGSAMTQMAVNAAIGASARGRIAVGIGTQGGQGAMSIGYGKRIGDSGSFSVGAAFGAGESSAGAGFGFDL
jgi:autotransporter adhesin